MNLITPEKRREAAALVNEGFSVSLAQDALTEEAEDNNRWKLESRVTSGA